MKDINFEGIHTIHNLDKLNRLHGRDLYREISSDNRQDDFAEDNSAWYNKVGGEKYGKSTETIIR